MTTTAKTLITHRSNLDPWGRNRQAAEEYERIAAKLNQEARDNWADEAWHRQIAIDLASELDYGFRFDNLFGTYIEVRTVPEFEVVRIKERRGLKVFYTSRGGYIDESQLRTETWELPRDTMGFHVSEHIDKLRADFATQIAELAALGQVRMETEVNRRILTLAQTAIPSTSSNYITTAGLTKDELDDAIRQVRDSLKPDGRGPVPVTVLGRATMVDKISNFDGFSNEAKEEIRLKGRLGVYKGANIVEIGNYADEDGASFTPANELWVLGGSAGQFVLYGGLQLKTWDENVVDYRHWRARRDVGGLIHHPEQVRRVVDTSVTP